MENYKDLSDETQKIVLEMISFAYNLSEDVSMDIFDRHGEV
jgi:hypothetical protein